MQCIQTLTAMYMQDQLPVLMTRSVSPRVKMFGVHGHKLMPTPCRGLQKVVGAGVGAVQVKD